MNLISENGNEQLNNRIVLLSRLDPGVMTVFFLNLKTSLASELASKEKKTKQQKKQKNNPPPKKTKKSQLYNNG